VRKHISVVRKDIGNFRPKLSAAFNAFQKARDNYIRALSVSEEKQEGLDAFEMASSLLQIKVNEEKTETALAPGFTLPTDNDPPGFTSPYENDPLIMEYDAAMAPFALESPTPVSLAVATLPVRQEAPIMGAGTSHTQVTPPPAGLKSSGETPEDYEDMV